MPRVEQRVQRQPARLVEIAVESYNEIIEIVRTVAPLGTGAFVLTGLWMFRRRPEPGSPMDLLLEEIKFCLARRHTRAAVQTKQERAAYDLATQEVAEARKARDDSAEVVPIRQKRKPPPRRARDPAENPPA